MNDYPSCLLPLSTRGMLPMVLGILTEYGITAEELMGTSRRRNITFARHEVWAFLHRKLSCDQIAGLWSVTPGAVSKAIRERGTRARQRE